MKHCKHAKAEHLGIVQDIHLGVSKVPEVTLRRRSNPRTPPATERKRRGRPRGVLIFALPGLLLAGSWVGRLVLT